MLKAAMPPTSSSLWPGCLMFPMVLREARMKIMCQVYRPENLQFPHVRMQSTIALFLLFALRVGTASSAIQSPAEYFSTWGLSPAYVQEQTAAIAGRDEFSLSSAEFQLMVRMLDRFQGHRINGGRNGEIVQLNSKVVKQRSVRSNVGPFASVGRSPRSSG